MVVSHLWRVEARLRLGVIRCKGDIVPSLNNREYTPLKGYGDVESVIVKGYHVHRRTQKGDCIKQPGYLAVKGYELSFKWCMVKFLERVSI